MSALDIVGLLVPVTYFIFLAVETVWPARTFPARKGWGWIGVAFLLLIGTVGTVVPLLFDPAWLAAHRWHDGSRLGVVGGTFIVLSALGGLGDHDSDLDADHDADFDADGQRGRAQ